MTGSEWLKLVLGTLGTLLGVMYFLDGKLSRWKEEQASNHKEILTAVQGTRETTIVQGKDIEVLKRDQHDHVILDETRAVKLDTDLTSIRLSLEKLNGRLNPHKPVITIGDQE